jgi:hypothetical protein
MHTHLPDDYDVAKAADGGDGDESPAVGCPADLLPKMPDAAAERR